MRFLFYNFDLIKEGYLPVVAHLLYDKSVVLLSESKAYSIPHFHHKLWFLMLIFKPETPL